MLPPRRRLSLEALGPGRLISVGEWHAGSRSPSHVGFRSGHPVSPAFHPASRPLRSSSSAGSVLIPRPSLRRSPFVRSVGAGLTTRSSERRLAVGSFPWLRPLRRQPPSLSLSSLGGYAFLGLPSRRSLISSVPQVTPGLPRSSAALRLPFVRSRISPFSGCSFCALGPHFCRPRSIVRRLSVPWSAAPVRPLFGSLLMPLFSVSPVAFSPVARHIAPLTVPSP